MNGATSDPGIPLTGQVSKAFQGTIGSRTGSVLTGVQISTQTLSAIIYVFLLRYNFTYLKLASNLLCSQALV